MSIIVALVSLCRYYRHAARLFICAAITLWLVAPATRAQSVPASHWEAILAAGHNDKSNYDYAVDDIALRLHQIGVVHIQMLTSFREEAARAGKILSTKAELEDAFGRLGRPPSEACFFFITSHANRYGVELALEARSRSLTTRELDTYLVGACRNRPQVVILSGCETGAMLVSKMTWSPHRIIMAAASRGRSSYGAKMTERHLNFERCLIKAYDDGAVTWREMYQNALPCIQEREDWLRVPYSRPDIYIGAKVADLRIPGR
jgi:hypothetical protein